jgi:hypothetical protein
MKLRRDMESRTITSTLSPPNNIQISGKYSISLVNVKGTQTYRKLAVVDATICTLSNKTIN